MGNVDSKSEQEAASNRLLNDLVAVREALSSSAGRSIQAAVRFMSLRDYMTMAIAEIALGKLLLERKAVLPESLDKEDALIILRLAAGHKTRLGLANSENL